MKAARAGDRKPFGGAPLWMSAILLLTVLVYLPGLPGEFMFDDHWNILQNPALEIDSLGLSELQQAAASGRAGPLKRPLAMLSFALNHYFSGFEPGAFKGVNLLIHLCNGLLVFFLARGLLQAPAVRSGAGHNPQRDEIVACLAAALWLLHPLNLSSVLYVVQRMNLLASLFSLLALVLYVCGRRQMGQGRGAVVLLLCAVALCMPLAALGKEVGLLIPLYLLLLELTLWRGQGVDAGQRRFLWVYHGLFAVAPVLLAGGYFLFRPDFILAGYTGRDFSLPERLLTESRVLWFYLRMVLVPDISSLALFHDDLAVSRGLFTPWTTLPALVGWVAAIALGILWRLRLPLVVFAMGLFLIGHSMESTIFSLELVHEHRNYLPQVGVLICLAYYLLGTTAIRARLGVSLALVALLWFGFTTGIRALAWSNLASFSLAQYQHHPESARSNYQMGRIYAMRLGGIEDQETRARYFEQARLHFSRASELQGHFSDGLFGILVLYATNGREPPVGAADELQRRLREERFQVNSVNQLNSLARCVAVGACALDPEVLNALILAARDNPTLAAHVKPLLPGLIGVGSG